MEKRLIAMANKLQSRHYSKILNLTKTSPEEWKILLQRKALLLKGNMQRERVVLINLPRFTSSSMPLRIRYSYSNLAGHGSFVLLAISYMESDFLSLRLCALSAISLSIAFQYYREKPLWIPIRWNFLFLLINGIMVGKLLSDESTAERIPTQQKSLYASVFKNKGMNLVDYHNLMSIAKIEEYKKGDELISYGTYNNKLHFVVSGKLNATRGNVFLGTIHDNQFVGEVGFLRMKEYYAQQDPSKPQSAIDHLKSDAKWIAKYLNKLVGNCNNFTVGMNKNKLGGDVGNGELKTIDHPVSKTSVMCDEDCEVYTWDFHELHELLRRNPAMDRVFELCMSSDLHKKLDTGVQLEPRLRYRQVLKGFLLSDEVLRYQ